MLKRVIPLLILLFGLVSFFAFDLNQYLSFDALGEHRVALLAWVASHQVAAPAAYLLVYVLVVAFSLPGGLLMTLTGGFLFGAMPGGMYAVTGATVGAAILFLIAKTSLGDLLLSKAGGTIKTMQAGFAKNAVSYMFVLRLVPIFPFFLVNLAPAFLGVSMRLYLLATFFGMMPATFIYAMAGSGLGSVLDQGQGVAVTSILTPQIMAALTGLALLSLAPVLWKRLNRKSLAEDEEPIH